MAAVAGSECGYSWSMVRSYSSASSTQSRSTRNSDSGSTLASSLHSSRSAPALAPPVLDHHADETGVILTHGPAAKTSAHLLRILKPMLDLARQRQANPKTAKSIVTLVLKSSVWPNEGHRDEIEAEYGRLRLHWDGDIDRLVVKAMPTLFHEASHRALANAIDDCILLHGLRPYVAPLGSATVDLGIARKKEGDSTFAPSHRIDGKPTLVIEAGDSETMSDLKRDAHRWLWSPATATVVELVLLVNAKTFRDDGEDRPWIRLSSWRRGQPNATNAQPVESWMDEIEYRGNPGETFPDFPLPWRCLLDPSANLPQPLDINGTLTIPGESMLLFARHALASWYKHKGLPRPAVLQPPP